MQHFSLFLGGKCLRGKKKFLSLSLSFSFQTCRNLLGWRGGGGTTIKNSNKRVDFAHFHFQGGGGGGGEGGEGGEGEKKCGCISHYLECLFLKN